MTFKEFEKQVNVGLVANDVTHQIECHVTFRAGVIGGINYEMPAEMLEAFTTHLTKKLWCNMRMEFGGEERTGVYSVDDLKKAYYFGQMDLHHCRSFEQALREIEKQKGERDE